MVLRSIAVLRALGRTHLLFLLLIDQYVGRDLPLAAILLGWPQFTVAFVVELGVRRIPVLLHYFLVERRRNCQLRVVLICLLVRGFY